MLSEMYETIEEVTSKTEPGRRVVALNNYKGPNSVVSRPDESGSIAVWQYGQPEMAAICAEDNVWCTINRITSERG